MAPPSIAVVQAWSRAHSVRQLLGAALLVAGTAQAQGSEKLTALMNAYRDASPTLLRQNPPAGVLAPSQALARVRVAPGVGLSQGLDDAGYQAATSRLIWISGLTRADVVMAMLSQSHCRTVLDPRYTDTSSSPSRCSPRISATGRRRIAGD